MTIYKNARIQWIIDNSVFDANRNFSTVKKMQDWLRKPENQPYDYSEGRLVVDCYSPKGNLRKTYHVTKGGTVSIILESKEIL